MEFSLRHDAAERLLPLNDIDISPGQDDNMPPYGQMPEDAAAMPFDFGNIDNISCPSV